METLVIIVLGISVIVLGALFYYLDKRQQDLVRKFNIITKNIDLLHENQEDLLNNQLKLRHGQKSLEK